MTAKLPEAGDVRAAPRDGRKRRSHDSRQRIVKAMLALVGEGHLSPSAEQVSVRAVVGLRSVFRHFQDMESLHRETSTIIATQLEVAARAPFVAVDWQGQLIEMVDRRARIYEAYAPYLRAGQLHRTTSHVLRARHVKFVAVLRRILVERLPANLRIAPETIEALDLLLSFEAWQRLRQEQRLAASQVRITLRKAVGALIGPVRP
jgi:hypothetical protein